MGRTLAMESWVFCQCVSCCLNIWEILSASDPSVGFGCVIFKDGRTITRGGGMLCKITGVMLRYCWAVPLPKLQNEEPKFTLKNTWL